LKRIKPYLRSSTQDDHLNDLAILNIESKLTVNINYDDIINKFSELKARRKCNCYITNINIIKSIVNHIEYYIIFIILC